MAVITRTKVYRFNAAHVLENAPRPEGLHGHSYRLEVTTELAAADAVIDEAEFDAEVERAVLSRLHGGRLSVAPATGEMLVEWIDDRLRASAIGTELRAVVLHETPKNRFVSSSSEVRHV